MKIIALLYLLLLVCMFSISAQDNELVSKNKNIKNEGIRQGVNNNTIVKNQEEVLTFKLLRNPVQDVLAFSIEDTNLPKELYIYTIHGQLIQAIEVKEAIMAMDVSYLSKGLYLAKLVSETKESLFRFVKN